MTSKRTTTRTDRAAIPENIIDRVNRIRSELDFEQRRVAEPSGAGSNVEMVVMVVRGEARLVLVSSTETE